MRYLDAEALSGEARDLLGRLERERFLFDLEEPSALEALREDVRRIAHGMDSESEPPPMLWSGIPWPRRRSRPSCGWCLVVSVGGTNTTYILARLEDRRLIALDPGGKEVGGDDVDRVRSACRMPTPAEEDTPDGFAMIARMGERIAEYLRPHEEHLSRTRHILLSWGFAHRVVRTAEHLLGGITAYTTQMTKDQAGFTEDLRGKDIGRLFTSELERQLGWSRPVTVANDGVMALHYFLSHENRRRYSQIGLFINGTGTNFCLAEPYAVRPEGIVSRNGEQYEPKRLVEGAAAAEGETVVRYFVNYETGSIELGATKTRFDVATDYPIEANVLSGGNAFEQQFRELVRDAMGDEVYRRLLLAARSGPLASGIIEGPEVARLAGALPPRIGSLFPGMDLDPAASQKLWLIARAVVTRSALHAAMVLAAVTLRRGFGLGDRAAGRPDLLGMEGSVWRTEGYPELVRMFWSRLIESELSVDFDAEKSYGASSQGPLHLTVLQHDEASRTRRMKSREAKEAKR